MRFVFSLLVLLSVSVNAEVLKGTVHTIVDGDTFLLSDGSQTHRIRINGIDAPELSQPFGKEAKEALRRQIEYQKVSVVWSKKDRYDRLIGVVALGSIDVGLRMIEEGCAWYFRQYEQDVSEVARVLYDAAETSAMWKRIGLWQADKPQAPWDARHPENVEPVVSESAATWTPSSINKVTTPPVPPQPSRVIPNPIELYKASRAQTTSRTYFRGPRGGCYYYSGSRKVYVDHSLCN